MSQFRQADPSVYETFLGLISKTFPEMSNYSFGLLFRESIKKSKGNVILAEIALPGKLLSYYAKNSDGNPFDFLMIVDEMIWACARPEDQVRIVRHELRHVHITDKGVPRLLGHDFADFHVEVELNADDPMWSANLCEIALAGYKQVKEGQADPRTDNRNAADLAPTSTPQRQIQIESAIGPRGGVSEDEEAEAGTNIRDAYANNLSLDDLARKRGLLSAEHAPPTASA